MEAMIRVVTILVLSLVFAPPRGSAQSQKPAQTTSGSDTAAPPDSSPAEPYKDEDGLIHRPNPGSSSSKAESVDLSPPADDDKIHPNSQEAVREAEDAAGLLEGDELGGIEEFHPWDPHKAEKDIEVGDYYFKRENYRGALDRYQEALYYKNNDAIATYRIATCQEKLGESEDARKFYEAYLKILPEGPLAADAKKAIARLGGSSEGKPETKASKKGGSSSKLPAPPTTQ
jgi:tetratricopeptide (TPR) repeat protein